MSGTGEESVQEKVVVDQEHQEVETGDAEKNEEHQMPSPQQQVLLVL